VISGSFPIAPDSAWFIADVIVFPKTEARSPKERTAGVAPISGREAGVWEFAQRRGAGLGVGLLCLAETAILSGWRRSGRKTATARFKGDLFPPLSNSSDQQYPISKACPEEIPMGFLSGGLAYCGRFASSESRKVTWKSRFDELCRAKGAEDHRQVLAELRTKSVIPLFD